VFRTAILAGVPPTGNRPDLDRASTDWSAFCDFDQYLHLVPGSGNSGPGIFERFGVTDGRVNPVGAFYSIGAGKKGLVPTRDMDASGVACYYLDISN
jgi:hypothetical protein